MWLRPMRAEAVRVGVDDIAQRVLCGIGSIAMPEAGTCVRQGEPIANIQCGRESIVLRAPMAGTIAAVNPRLAHAPSLLHQDPYRRGWFVEIEPRDRWFDGLLTGNRARAWLASEEQRL